MNVVELEGGGLFVVKEQPAAVAVVGKRMVAEVSNENEDSSRDIIWQGKNKKGAGWLLDGYNANPILTWMHDRSIPNIGSPDVRAKVATVESRRVLVLDPFSFDLADPFAAGIAGKYERGSLKQTSVGFTSSNWEPRDGGGREYFEQRLLEVAGVNIGDNQTTRIVSKMLAGHGLFAKVESSGDREVEELKELLNALSDELITTKQELRAVTNIVKSLGDFDSNAPVGGIISSTNAASGDREIQMAATALLLRLRQIGTAQ